MAKFKTFVSANRSRKVEENHIQLEIVNFCVPGMLSRCGAGMTWSEQKNCRFAIKSEFSHRCMYFNKFIGDHCDCLDAQLEVKSPIKERT